MAGNRRGEGDSTLSNLADLSVHRHQFCVPSTRAQGRAVQNAPISIAHCWRRGVGPPRFSFLATSRFDPLTNGRIRFLSSPFEFSRRGRNSRDSFLFSSFLRIVRGKEDWNDSSRGSCSGRVETRRERVEKSRTLEGTESRVGTIAGRRVTLEAERGRFIRGTGQTFNQRSRFHCNPTRWGEYVSPIFSSPLMESRF